MTRIPNKIATVIVLIIFTRSFSNLSAQTGTGYEYMPSYVNVTGGGNMPDTTNGYTCNCDGTGATDATACLQTALNTASSLGKPLLIPYTTGFYKISSQLLVKGSVMGIGGMPTIKQTADAVGLRLGNNMTGWIYNLHIVGNYAGSGTSSSEYSHNISIGGVNGVTISNNLLETPKGDCITDNAQEQDANICRNVLITNNSLINAWRCDISIVNVSDRWAIMNNYLTYTTSYVDPIDLEPWKESSYLSNIEIGYNNIQSPKPAWNDASHFYQAIVALAGWFDVSPGGKIYTHHNFGAWGVPIVHATGYQGAASTWTNVVTTNNVQGNTPPASSDLLAPSVPVGLAAEVSDSSFVLSWDPSTDNVAVTGYEVFKDGVSAGKTIETSMLITGLSCSEANSMTVKARDAVINWSDASTPLVVISPYCYGSDTIITFDDRPVIENGLSGNYAGINWGQSGWATYNETTINPASIVLKMDINEISQQVDTIFVLSEKVLKSLNMAVVGDPIVKEISLISTGNPDCIWSDMSSTWTEYKTNWTNTADTILIKIICDAGASSLILDNLVFGDAEPPTIPEGLASSEIKYTSVTLSWTASADNTVVAGYEVFKDEVSVGKTSGTSMIIQGLVCNTEYLFTVKAKDMVGNWSDSSDPLGITTLECDVNAPEIPAGLIARNLTSSSFVLAWNPSADNDGIAGYDVFNYGVKFGNTTTDTLMNISGLAQNTSYSMTVKAKDPSGNVSVASIALLVTTVQCELPQEWTSVDIGVTTGQSACESAGVYTITGSGADIWGTADEFSFTYKSLNGDGVITAKVESIQNTDPWSKSGVMIRQDLTPGSKYIDCIVTPANGIGFQNRPAANGVCSVIAASGGIIAPYWVKLERIGNMFNAYTSADGVAWTQIGKSTSLIMTTKLYMGLAVTAHSAGKSCVSVLSNVSAEELITGFSEKEKSGLNSDVHVYPNPVSEVLTITNIPLNADISVFSMNGKTVRKDKSFKNNSLSIDVSNWNKGIYLVKVQSEKGVSVKKLIVK